MATNAEDTLFVDQKYTLKLNTGKDLTGAAVQIAYRKPDGVTGFWNASGAGTEISRDIEPEENDVAGTWYFHSYVIFAGETEYTPGERVSLRILNLYED